MTIVGNNNGRTNGIDISHIVQFLEIEPCRLEDRNWSRLILSFVIVIKFLSYDSHVEIQCLQWFYAGPCYTKSIVRTKMRHRETSPLDLSCATSYVTWRESLCRWNEPLHTLYTYISLHLVIGIKKKKEEKKTRKHLVSTTPFNTIWHHDTTRQCKNSHSIFNTGCDRKSSCLRDRKVNAERNKLWKIVKLCTSCSVWHNKNIATMFHPWREFIRFFVSDLWTTCNFEREIRWMVFSRGC